MTRTGCVHIQWRYQVSTVLAVGLFAISVAMAQDVEPEPPSDPETSDTESQSAGPDPVEGTTEGDQAIPYPQTVDVQPTEPALVTEPDAAQLDELVVTATRREQSISDVVGGIQAFDGKAMERLGAEGFEDYIAQIAGAGLRIDGSGQAKIGIRGVSNISGNQLGTFSGSSPVGIYINDLPIQGSGQLPDLDLYDLERVEALKGPQGTLYGEGAMGGAVRMIVREPRFDTSDIKGETGLSWTERGGLNRVYKLAGGSPIIEDTLSFRAVAVMSDNSGFIDLPNQNRENGNSTEKQAYRLSTSWLTSDKLEVGFLYLKDLGQLDGTPNVAPGSTEYESPIVEPEYAQSDLNIGGLTLKYGFEGVDLTSVTAITRGDREAYFRLALFKDLTNGAVSDRAEPMLNFTWDRGLSQEIRLVSAGEGPLSWVGGLYYQERDQRYNQTEYIMPSTAPPEERQIHRHGNQPSEHVSAYGEATYSFASHVDATLGLRAVKESIEIHDFFQSYGVLAAAEAAANDPNPQTLDVTSKYEQYLPKVSLGWHVTDEDMVYALASRGYRTTTPNVQVNFKVGPPILEADTLWNYELGVKTQWFDRLLKLNLTAYHVDWKDLQADRVGEGRLGDVPIDIIYIDNIGDAEVNGIELDSSMRFNNGLVLAVAGAYQEGRLVKLAEGSTAIPGSRIPNSPEWSGSVSASYSYPLFGQIGLNMDAVAQYVDDMATTEVTDHDPTGSETAAYTKVSASLGFGTSTWGFDFFGDNILDERIELQNASLVEIEHWTTMGRPRTYGARVWATFE